MFKSEGFRGFFKGNGATVAKIAPFSAFEFYFYALFKNNLFPGVEKTKLSNWQKLVAGGLTGACAQFLVYPMDLVKTYLTVNIESNTKVTMISQAKSIVAEQGFLGLYKGIGLSTIGIAPFIGIKLTSFDMLMSAFAPEKGHPKTIYYNLALGATAGTIAVTFTYPIDLTRRLL
jgi:solute carrier family 25 phosphate transporter 23/24/25/41